MRKYKDFKEYMEDNYLDTMLEKLEPYIIGHKGDLEEDDFCDVSWVEPVGETVAGIKREAGERVIEAVADKGYNEPEDVVACLENDIVPNVILPEGEDTYELEMPYEDMRDITDTGEDPDRIKRSLRAGASRRNTKG